MSKFLCNSVYSGSYDNLKWWSSVIESYSQWQDTLVKLKNGNPLEFVPLFGECQSLESLGCTCTFRIGKITLQVTFLQVYS